MHCRSFFSGSSLGGTGFDAYAGCLWLRQSRTNQMAAIEWHWRCRAPCSSPRETCEKACLSDVLPKAGGKAPDTRPPSIFRLLRVDSCRCDCENMSSIGSRGVSCWISIHERVEGCRRLREQTTAKRHCRKRRKTAIERWDGGVATRSAENFSNPAVPLLASYSSRFGSVTRCAMLPDPTCCDRDRGGATFGQIWRPSCAQTVNFLDLAARRGRRIRPKWRPSRAPRSMGARTERGWRRIASLSAKLKRTGRRHTIPVDGKLDPDGTNDDQTGRASRHSPSFATRERGEAKEAVKTPQHL